jgi:hypothetical protein
MTIVSRTEPLMESNRDAVFFQGAPWTFIDRTPCVTLKSFLIAERVLADGMMDLQGADLYTWLRDTSTNTQMTAPGRTS